MGVTRWLNGFPGARSHEPAARIAISAVPVAGGPAIELFNWLFAEPLTRRRDEWLERLASDLVRVEEKFDVRLELLGRDSRFLSLVVEASRSALGAHQEDKRRALRNLLLNAAVKPDSDSDREQTLLALISRLTPSHLAVLDGRRSEVVRPVGYDPVTETIVSPGNLGFVSFLSTDLLSLGLLETTAIDCVRVSAMGAAMLATIRDPLQAPANG